jgi:hypothetical protein
MTVNNYFCTTGFILLLIFSAHAQQAKNAPQQETPKAENSETPASSVQNADIKQPESPIKATQSGQDQPSRGGDTVTRAETIQIGINALLFLVVLWQTLIYIQQRNVMRQQVAHAKVSERAYIGVKEAVLNGLSVGSEPCFTVIFLNGGRTPAWKVKVPARVGMADTFQDEGPDNAREGTTFMPAGDEREVNYPIPVKMNGAWLEAISTGKKKVYLSGEVYFQDSWGEQHLHSFKLIYNPAIGRVQDYKGEEIEPEIKIIP